MTLGWCLFLCPTVFALLLPPLLAIARGLAYLQLYLFSISEKIDWLGGKFVLIIEVLFLPQIPVFSLKYAPRKCSMCLELESATEQANIAKSTFTEWARRMHKKRILSLRGVSGVGEGVSKSESARTTQNEQSTSKHARENAHHYQLSTSLANDTT